MLSARVSALRKEAEYFEALLSSLESRTADTLPDDVIRSRSIEIEQLTAQNARLQSFLDSEAARAPAETS